jgi:hypothetical protein
MSRATLKAIQAAAGNAGEAVYVDDVFSTYVYAGNSSTNQIDNGIDLDGEGGLIWLKKRSAGTTGADHSLIDTERGRLVRLKSNTNDNNLSFDQLDSFNSDGFTLSGSGEKANLSGKDYASWTFRNQPGFFDVVTYSGNSSTQTISHNLGAVPGMIIIKRYDGGLRDWAVYHRSVGNGHKLKLNGTNAQTAFAGWNYTTPTDTEFYLGNDSDVNNSAGTYVAYLFAHDAQDFGTDSDESIIKCGSVTYGVSGDVEVDLGWEPQWVMYKRVDGTGNWWMLDSMRGWEAQRYAGTFSSSTGGKAQVVFADLSNSETDYTYGAILPSGFKLPSNQNAGTGTTKYIYVAIRRPHKPAEEFAATELFDLGTRNGVNDNPIDITGVNFPVDAALITSTNQQEDRAIGARLRGKNALFTNTAGTESDRFAEPGWDHQDGVTVLGDLNKSGYSYIDYFFRRAPGFFDVVTYTGTNSQVTVPHNLGVVPQLILNKPRTSVALGGWYSLCTILPSGDQLIRLDGTDGSGPEDNLFPVAPTSSNYYVNSLASYSNTTYISYLFATVPGISKVGSYSGTGSNVDVNCGFTSGARFVLVKRTDSTGDWYVWDSVRGITAGNDPYLLLNSNQSQTTGTDYIDPLSSGFTITSSAPAALNASGGSYLFLAIA